MKDLKICLRFGQLKSVTRNGPVDGRIFAPRYDALTPLTYMKKFSTI